MAPAILAWYADEVRQRKCRQDRNESQYQNSSNRRSDLRLHLDPPPSPKDQINGVRFEPLPAPNLPDENGDENMMGAKGVVHERAQSTINGYRDVNLESRTCFPAVLCMRRAMVPMYVYHDGRAR